MERRAFLKGALAIFGAVTVGVAASTQSAEAAALDTVKDIPAAAPDVEQVALGEAEKVDAEGQFYFVVRRRRRWYRPRRRVYYYRPRRVYYRPRRVYYRRRYYW